MRFVRYHPQNAEFKLECDTVIICNEKRQMEMVTDSLIFSENNSENLNLDTISELQYKTEM